MRSDDDTPPSLLDGLRPTAGFDMSEVVRVIGDGDELWHRAAVDLLRWRVKTRSGFRVPGGAVATPGARLIVRAGILAWSVPEPVEVVAVVDEPSRVGFAYATRPGHPLDGEEAFVLDRTADGVITFTIRSRSRAAAHGPWHRAYPLLRIAQRVTRWRYLHALR